MKKYTLLLIAILISVAVAVLVLFILTAQDKAKDYSPKKDIALQLYSVRDYTSRDFDSTIVEIGKMGYTAIEAANFYEGNFYDKTPSEFKAAVENAGLKALSSHTTRTLTEKELASKDLTAAMVWWDNAIDAHAAAGMAYIVAPWMEVPKTLADLQTYCEYYNEIGKRCKAKGLSFGYHNHAHEFTKIEDHVMYDYMIEHTNPEYVFFQMDVYWVVRGQQSPVEYFNKYPGRFHLLHIKDDKELGQSGMVGFDAIFNNIAKSGAKHIIVEVEKYNYTPLESVQKSLDYLNNSSFVKQTYNN